MQNNAVPPTAWEKSVKQVLAPYGKVICLAIVTYHSYSTGNLLLSGTESILVVLEVFLVPT